MITVYYGEKIPETVNRSMFLAGPTPRSDDVKSWRPDALRLLEKFGYDGVVYIPEFREGCKPKDFSDYEGMVEWEKKGLTQADVILFWVPRNNTTMPAFTTNVEFGTWLKSGKCVYGRPDNAEKIRYLDWLYKDLTKQTPQNSLEFTVLKSIEKENLGYDRTGGERFVPIQVWKTDSFQLWYKSHKNVGNRLDDARLLWSFIPKGSNKVFSFVLWVKVWIEKEQRYKENEWIFSRRDISTVVLYEEKSHDPYIILVKEFRSPVRNEDGFVYENPGGSSVKGEDALVIAAHEVEEETSLKIDPSRIKYYGSKQVAGTLSTHHSCLFGCALSEEEIKEAIKIANSGKSFGIESDSEKTYLHVCKLSQINNLGVDWSTIGMIYTVVKEGATK